jgi:hypothetical protein
MSERHNMGIGVLGFRNLVFKRKFRFTFELFDICNTGQRVPEHFVKVCSRPNLEVEEVELNFLNARTWLPGKAAWQTMTVTYIDVATDQAAPLFSWLASVYNFTNPVTLEMGSRRSDYTASAMLKLWDGCGQLLEIWELADVWPTGINFGDLDYSSSEECTIELTMRYSQVKYTPVCPQFAITRCCSPCDGGSQPPTSPNNQPAPASSGGIGFISPNR